MNVNTAISEMRDVLSGVLDKRIALVLRLDHDLGDIEADPSEVEQVLLNLIVNARDAMPNGGTLTIATQNVTLPRPAGRADQLVGEFVAICVLDTGTGIDPKVQSHIFEPFFTTKRESGGTGLGLPTVYGIVRQNGGDIEVNSTLGAGSTFTAYFPRRHMRQASCRKPSRSACPVPASPETILLAEDMSELREMMHATLQSNGYRVIEARDGEDAVRKADSFDGPIDLILTDIKMPRMDGSEAVLRIRRKRPNLKAIFITGYAEQVPDQEAKVLLSVTLEKPVRPQFLLAKIREVLDQQPAPDYQVGD
jgi:CheY-like chemotaxis protein